MYTSPQSLADLLELGRSLKDLEQRGQGLFTIAAEDLLTIRDRNGNTVPLLANTAQQSFEDTLGRQNIVLKARQMGITTWIAGRMFLKTITTPGVLTVQVAQTREAAESIFRMVQRFFDGLTPPLQKELRRSRSNVGQMIFSALDSEFRILSAADRNAGRGLTIQNLHCSELSRWPGDAAETLAGMRAALAPTGELVMESTPNGAQGCFYDEWQNAPERGIVQHFLPWWKEAAYVAEAATGLREDELGLMAAHSLTPAQIGFRRTLEAGYRGLRAQEFAEDPESCFRASGECCFEIAAIDRRMAELPDPIATHRNGTLEIWLPPEPGRSYLLAVDPAGGGSNGDYSAVQVLDLATGMQCAELRQHISQQELASLCAQLAREYNDALIAVERNSIGAGVIAYLGFLAPVPRLYEHDGKTGWLTNSVTKPRIVSGLGQLLSESPEVFRSKRLLRECRSFITLPSGGSGAAGGAHDDLVMAMAIGHAVRNELLSANAKGRRA